MSEAMNVTSSNDSLSIQPFVISRGGKETRIVRMPKEHTAAALWLFFEPGDIVEMQAFHHDITGMSQNGYYDDHQKLVDDSVTLSNTEYNHIYFAINKIDPDAVKSKNRELNKYVKCKTGQAVSAGDVLKRTLLAIDFDLVRADGYSKSCATNEEKRHGVELSGVVASWLKDRGWLLPYKVDSGNGVHLYYIIDLPNTPDSQQLIKSFAAVLAAKFDNEHVHIDQSLDDANQLMRLPGIMNRKGEDTPERPHRLCCFTEIPDRRPIVSRAQIEEIIKELGGSIKKAPAKKTRKQGPHRRTEAEVDAEAKAISEKLGTEIKKVKVEKNNGGKLYTLICPFCHQDKGHIWLAYSGAKTFDCKDDDCIGKKKYGKNIEWWQFAREFDLPYGDRFSNYTEECRTDEKGKEEIIRQPKSLEEIIIDLRERTGGWPKSNGGVLFCIIDGKVWECHSFDRLFAAIELQLGIIDWATGIGYVTKREFFEGLHPKVEQYDDIAHIAHYPKVKAVYYTCDDLVPENNGMLNRLVDFFCPETITDKELLKSAIMTPLWGNSDGARPLFEITSPAGRGTGKSTLCMAIGNLYGGYIDFNQTESIQSVKKRLLSPDAVGKRICIIDNIKSSRWSWGELESLLTNRIISGARLYHGEASRANLLTWFVTMNGSSLSSDLAWRTVEIRLKMPTYSGDWSKKLREFIDTNRQAIFANIAWLIDSPPVDFVGSLSRRPEWDRDILSKLDEPNQLLETIMYRRKENDSEEDLAADLLERIRRRLEWCGYDPDIVEVHIPAEVMRDWYAEVADEDGPIKKRAATIKIKQMIDEDKIPRRILKPTRVGGRGFLWHGEKAPLDTSTERDLPDRISKREFKHF